MHTSGTSRPAVLGCRAVAISILVSRFSFTVGAEHADGKLRAREDDGLVEALEHKAECGCGVGHGVRAVQDDEARGIDCSCR